MADTNGNTAPASNEIPAGTATSQEFSWFFKTDKIRDDEGKVIGTGRKHPDVNAVLPVPTYAQIGEAMEEGGKTAEFVLECVTDAIYKAARNQVNEWRETNGLDKDFGASNFDLNKLTLAALAVMPKSERAGAAISDEDWTAFFEDYSHVMLKVVGYDEKKVKLHLVHYKTKLSRIRSDKPAVQKLLDLLNIWATKSETLEDNSACFEDLTKRATKYLRAEDRNVAEAL